MGEKRRMIIHETKRCLYILSLVFCVAFPLQAEELKPAPTFQLINPGYGAAAMGMSGAFVAVANDLSTVFWNPGGLGQLPGFQIHVDYRWLGDSDEDFSREVSANRFESMQRFAVSGNQFQSWSVSYAFDTGKVAIVPAFAWQRTTTLGPVRDLKETAGVVDFVDNVTFFQSEGLFSEKYKSQDEEYVVGLGARASDRVFIGGTISFLSKGPERELSGTFHDSFLTRFQEDRTDLTLDQTLEEDLSGSYFKVGVLLQPHPALSLGGYMRFPYTRKSKLTLTRTGSVINMQTLLDQNGRVLDETTTTGTLDERATAETEVDFPMEWSGGAAIRSQGATIAASFTYANWEDVFLTTQNSSDPALIPEGQLLFPTLRPGAVQADSLIQWRLGFEYSAGRGQTGLVFRTGYFWDGQPYLKDNGDHVYFKGYSFGAGFLTRSFRFDVAFVSEKGDAMLTALSRENSHFKNRRWVFSVDFLSL